MHRVLVVCTVVVILVGVVGVSGVSGVVTPVGDPAPQAVHAESDGLTFPQQDAPSFDFVTFDVTVSDDASARWTFRYTRVLDNDTAVEEFESFAKQFGENETQFYENFRQQAEALAASGANETGRPMTAESFSRDARVERGSISNDLGVVEVSFRWTGFARVDGDRIVVGDVFSGGLYLAEHQRFQITAGDGLTFDGDPDPEPDGITNEDRSANQSAYWEGGERLFRDGTPHVVLVPVDVDDTDVAQSDPEPDDPGSDGTDDPVDDQPWTLVAGGLVLLGLVGAVAWWRVKQREVPDRAIGERDRSTVGPVPLSEEQLLSDEDRVTTLLERNGGRMKQVDIVRETDWSKSKVSMLLSEMETEGTISKLRVGRENIVSLAGHEPAATRSSLDPDDE